MIGKKSQVGPFLLRVVANAVALWIATLILPGLKISGSVPGQVAGAAGPGASGPVAFVLGYLLIGALFGLVNALIRPLVGRLALPVTLLTLGLFALVLNAAMLELTAWISRYTPVHLIVDSFFWTAVLGAIIISIVSSLVGAPLGAGRKRPKLKF
ncbi:phage holin family protein [Sinomonas terrae]|uniref:Phage holin family protein n=1 Tax=Sinomonas terrae TaxID=2908838 RepID=A0ABS9TVS7_9MICC|nr:phage holin family protein [Sinomonas terrae]MCH6468470.1 phage holin family protein [Sinomonas terrae]